MFLAFAISVSVILLGILPLSVLIATSGDNAARRVQEKKTAFRTWDREKMKALRLHFAAIERTTTDGAVQRVCGLSMEASERMTAIFDGRALALSRSTRRSSNIPSSRSRMNLITLSASPRANAKCRFRIGQRVRDRRSPMLQVDSRPTAEPQIDNAHG